MGAAYPILPILGEPPKFKPTYASVVSDKALRLGQYVQTYGYYAYGDGGANTGVVVAGGTGTDDGGSFTDLDNGLQVQWLFPGGTCNIKQWGGVGDGDVANMATDTRAVRRCFDFSAANGLRIEERLDNVYRIDGYKGDNASWTAGAQAHGGIIVPDGLRASGLHLKNGADNWRSVLRVRSGEFEIDRCIIDGDVDNYDPIPLGTGSTNSSQGPIRGEGIVFEGGGTVTWFRIANTKVMNTGHYGIGLENVSIDGGLIENPVFQNIGGDCIDGKSYISGSNYKRNIRIENFLSLDGCGHNYIGKYDEGEGHTGQACIDMCRGMYVNGVVIRELDTYGGTASTNGVRFRPYDVGLGRNGSRGCKAENITIFSSKDPSEGATNLKRVCGISVNDDDCVVANAETDGCYWGFYAWNISDYAPQSGHFSNITARNCTGAGDDAFGIGTSSETKNLQFSNLTADGCETGLLLRGQGNSYRGVTLKNNTVNGLEVSLATIVLNNISDILFEDNATDISESTLLELVKAQTFIHGNVAVTNSRDAYYDVVSTANNDNWSGDDVYLGGLRSWRNDDSGVVGIAGAIRMRATGPSGSAFGWEVSAAGASANDVPVARFKNDIVDMLVRLRLVPTTVSGLGAATAGATAFVSDATQTVAAGHGAVVAGGGSNNVPVYADGTNWRIG